jgi:hypothetical protein
MNMNMPGNYVQQQVANSLPDFKDLDFSSGYATVKPQMPALMMSSQTQQSFVGGKPTLSEA